MKILKDRIVKIVRNSRFILDIDNDPFDGIKSTIVILNEKDLLNENNLNKLIGYKIDVVFIPKSLVDTYDSLPAFEMLKIALGSEGKIMFF